MKNNIQHGCHQNAANSVVLIVDDVFENIEILSRLLAENGLRVRAAINGNSALKTVQTKAPDLILLDIRMPDMDGYEVCRILKDDPRTKGIPVIFISGLEETTDKIKAFEAGGVDYITKPFHPEEVVARVKNHLALRRLKKNLEEMVAQRTSELVMLASAIEQIVEGVIITDPRGIIEYINPAFEKITGRSQSEVAGTPSEILSSDEHDEAFCRTLYDTLQKGNTWSGRLVNRRKDGTIIKLDTTISPIYNFDGELLGYVSVRRDVTEQLKIEEMLRQAQKMEAIGTLAGGIAHDFNNILSAVLGYTELALDEELQDLFQIRKYMTQVYKSANRAKDLVSQILSFSRQTEQDKRSVHIIPVAKEVVKFLKASLPSSIEISLDIRSETDTILADTTQIHQVLMNLCTNAWHSMKEKGGAIAIRIETIQSEKEELSRYPDLTNPPYLKLMVSDTGYGIKKENLNSIFVPYFTTKAKGDGTGLGLAVVHGIVKSCNGSIYVQSEIDKGTTFKIFFPLFTKKAAHCKIENQVSIPKGNEKILFVDDEETLAKLGKKTLESLGYDVVCQTDPVKALDMLKNGKEAFDLVITDKTMPRFSGFDFAIKIKMIKEDMPILLCTGYCEREDIERCKKSGINDFVMKPVDRMTIGKKIRHLLDEKGDIRL